MKPPNNDIIPQGYRMTELGALPEEWEVVRLGEYCKVFSGYAFKSDDFCNNGVLVVKIGNLQNGSIVFNTKESFFPREKINDDISKYILNEGDILIALTGATTGKISLVPKSVNGALLNQRVGKFSIYNDSLYKSFVMYYVMTDEFQNHIKKNILQSAQGNISPKQIETFSIPLPPLPEQQKIAAVLSAVQEAKEKTEAVIAATKALKKSMMKHLFTYGPVSPQEAENVPLKETEIGKVPENWELISSNKVFSYITDGTHDTPEKLTNGIPLIKSKQIKNGKINKNEIDYFISKKDYEIINKRSKVDKYDILFSMIGTIGETALIIEVPDFAIKNVGLFKTNGNYELAIYTFYWLQTANAKNYIDKNTSGTSQKYIKLVKLRNYPILFPPLPIQQKIASILSAIDEKIEAEENKKKALEDLFKSLLHNLMTAKIRVNQLEITS